MKAKIYIIICLVFIGAILLRLGYVAYQRRPIDAYKLKSSVIADKSSYSVGDTISWTVTICKYHDEEFYSQRSLVNLDNGKEYPIPELLTKATLKKGECATVHPSMAIPTNDDLISGNYKLCSQIIVPDVNKSIKPFKYCTNPFIIK